MPSYLHTMGQLTMPAFAPHWMGGTSSDFSQFKIQTAFLGGSDTKTMNYRVSEKNSTKIWDAFLDNHSTRTTQCTTIYLTSTP